MYDHHDFESDSEPAADDRAPSEQSGFERPTPSRRSLLRGIGGAAAATLAGCAGPSLLPGSDGAGGSMRYAGALPPITLDPVEIVDAWSAAAANRVFEGLLTYDDGTGLVPALAADEPAVGPEGRTYSVTLVADARFQNGDPVTAEDVRYSYEAPVSGDYRPTPPAWLLDVIETIETPDERTVEFTLSHPYPAFDHALTRPIVPRAVREADPEAFGRSVDHTVGSGPYRPTVIKPGTSVELAADEDYWGPREPRVSRLRIVGNRSGLARSMSLRTHQNDVVERVHPKLWDVTERMPNVAVSKAESYRYVYLAFNLNEGPTTRPTVREAVDRLVDLDELVERFVGETGARQYGPTPARVADEWGFPVDEWAEIPAEKDPAAAKRLLHEVDATDGWRPRIAVPPDMLREKFADAVAGGLSDAGFRRARVVKRPWPSFRESVVSGIPSEYHAYVGVWSGNPDPDSFLYPLFHENNEGLTNGTFYRNEAVMEALSAARRTTDRAERERLYEDAVSTLLRDRVHLPICRLDNSFGVRSRIEGFDPHPLSPLNPRMVGGEPPISISGNR